MNEAVQAGAFSRDELNFVAGTAVATATPSAAALEIENLERRPMPRVLESVQDDDVASRHNAVRTVSTTFRLPSDLPALLIQISAARKVRREAPFTQQDIVAEALRKWIQAHSDQDQG